MAYEKPLPIVNPDNKPFWDQCRNHRLTFQKCRECGRMRWPPSFLCPECLSEDAEWTDSRGEGSVYSFVVYHEAYHPGFKGDLPYVVALVELAEGPRLLTNIVHCEPGAVFCGMPVRIFWADVTPDISLPKFEPRPGGMPQK